MGQSIVVGIDGSRAAVDAALWAVDEAVSRDIPLRLVCAIDPGAADADPHNAARELATAELAVRYAFTAVESTEKPVKIEVEILQDKPSRALVEASRYGAMICVGAIGLTHATQGRIGSTAAALANSAHCPVAVIRRNAVPRSMKQGCILVEVDQSPSSNPGSPTCTMSTRWPTATGWRKPSSTVGWRGGGDSIPIWTSARWPTTAA